MHKLLFTLFLLLSSLNAETQWMDYSQALKSAQTQDKKIMVMIGRSTCGVCKYMKGVVFNDGNVAPILKEKFLSVYIDLDFDDVPKGLTYIGTPTFHFLDKDGKTLYRIDGGKTVPSFLTTLKELN